MLSLQSKGLLGVFSSTTVQKHQFLVISLLYDPTVTFLGFPDSSVGKESACSAGDSSSVPGSVRSTGGGIGYPLQHSGLENPMDCVVHGVANSLSLSFFLTSYLTTGGTRALTVWTFVSKVMSLVFFFLMSLLFNTLSRFVIVFLLRSKHLFPS